MIVKVIVTYDDGTKATFTGTPVDFASIPNVSGVAPVKTSTDDIAL